MSSLPVFSLAPATRRLPVWLALLLLVAPCIDGRAATLTGDKADRQISSTGDTSKTGDKIARVGSSTNDGGRGYVIPFRLPDLGPVQAPFSDASFAFTVVTRVRPLPADAVINLDGLPARDSAAVSESDYVAAGQLIQEGILGRNDSAGACSTDATGSAALTAWLNRQYAGGANAGRFVFLRLVPTRTTDARAGYDVATANAIEPSTHPRIEYNVGRPAPSVRGPAAR